ncbi:MAG: winged helix-turn-helix transcriptional regulator [Dehalococcoidales bacterium]|nr:winged helix-turn-helix transcriptional regulator [Dehalococcoidales bacterium]
MAQVLRNKNMATRFQILVEIAANQPYIQQKDIARRIGVTSQAVSEYINKLEKDSWISSDGRSRYRVTREGVNWVLKALRELQQYSTTAERALTNIDTWAAIAEIDLKQGETVGLAMKDGLLFATAYTGKDARGITTCPAQKGEDVGITNIEGIVTLELGQITILEVPDIQNGGTKSVDLNKLRKQLTRANLVGAIGVEAIVALQRVNRKPDYLYGVTQAAVEAARSGLSFAIVCTSSESPTLQQKLADENISYRLVDMRKR